MFARTSFGLPVMTMLLSTVAPISAAQAQTDASKNGGSPESDGIADIVVTAQRRFESLQKVPIAVTPVTPATLTTAGVASSLDLPRVAPGLTVAPTVASAILVPYLRGVGSNSPATGNDSSIALYIDGVYQSDKLANIIDFPGVERLEVLKGPQGTLFGRNATGGAINIVTKRPKGTLSGDAEVSFQRYNRLTAKGYITGPIADNLNASIGVSHIGGGDYLLNTGTDTPGKFGGTRSDAVDFKLNYVGGRLDVLASIMYVDRSTDDLGSNLYAVPGTIPVGVQAGGRAEFDLYKYSGSPNLLRTKTYRATMNAKYSADAFDIVSITAYVHSRDHNKLDFDGTSANLQYFDEIQGTKDFSQELQLLSTGGGPLQWVLGAYYSKNNAYISPLNVSSGVPYNTTDADHHSYGDPASYPAGGSVTSIEARGPTRSMAAYAQATYSLTDTTRLTAGFRYTSERRAYSYAVSAVGTLAPGFVLPTLTTLFTSNGELSATFKKPSWRLAIDQQLAPDVMAYASWNRGFKSGSYNMNGFPPTGFQDPVNPEKLDAYEIGLKSKFFDRKVQLNAAAFYYDYSNIQVDIITGNPLSPTELQNAASETLYGMDMDLIFEPVSDLRFYANASLLHAKYGDYQNANAFEPVILDANGNIVGPDPNGNGSPIKIDASGSRGLFAPKWSFTLGGDYTAHLGDGSKIQFSGSYYRTAGFKTGNGSLDRVREYDSLGASVTYTFPSDNFYVRAYGINLTDRKIISNQLLQLKYSRNVIQPITYGIAVGARF